jgi:hypothetical protein
VIDQKPSTGTSLTVRLCGDLPVNGLWVHVQVERILRAIAAPAPGSADEMAYGVYFSFITEHSSAVWNEGAEAQKRIESDHENFSAPVPLP